MTDTQTPGSAPILFSWQGAVLRLELPQRVGREVLTEGFATLKRKAMEKEQVFLLIDASRASTDGFDAGVRSYARDQLKDLGPVLKERMAGVAYVVSSKLVRGALNAVFWLFDSNWPRKIFNDHDAADAWLKGLSEGQ